MQHDLAAMRARLTPRRPALWFRDRWYSYRELNERARRSAAALAALGVGHGDRVGIIARNHIAHFDLLLAAPKLGCIVVPFNHRLSAPEQRQLFELIEPKLLLHDAHSAEVAETFAGARRALAQHEGWLRDAIPAPVDRCVVGDEDIALILFTGGSTGVPKGAMIPYRQQFYNAVNTITGWGLRDDDCAVQATPAFHAAVNALSTPLLHVGGRVILQEEFDPAAYLELAQAHAASLLFMVPTMYQMLAEHPAFGRTDLGAVRWAISGGAPCPPAVRQYFVDKGIRFKQGYGMTEAGVNCFAIELDDAERQPQAVGVPMPHALAAIREPDGQPVTPGDIGELTLSGPHVFAGYFRRPEATAECLRDGWLWTGDLARQDDAGLFSIVGRRKDMFISGGENVYPSEIEATLYAWDEVAEAAVLPVPHERWGEVGLAAVALRPGHTLGAAEVRARLKAQLAGYKVPREILFLDALPKSAAGKILKPAIRAHFDACLPS